MNVSVRKTQRANVNAVFGPKDGRHLKQGHIAIATGSALQSRLQADSGSPGLPR